MNQRTIISNPYAIEQNDTNLLRNGLGLFYGDIVPATQSLFNFSRVMHTTSIVLTNEVTHTHHDKTQVETVINKMIEDALKIKLNFLKSDQINQSDIIEDIQFINISGPSFLDIENYNILFCLVNFYIIILEKIEEQL